MNKKVLIMSTSPRKNGNFEMFISYPQLRMMRQGLTRVQ